MKEKEGIFQLAAILESKGVDKIVISSGSRNAPIIQAFASHPNFECFSIVDERSAAFFALGMAQQTGKAVAIACTSGSAVLNYAPAIAEAYYQKVPLLVLTADRPVEWIDQADAQTIRQKDIFSNIVKYSCELPQLLHSKDDEWYHNRLVSEAMHHCTHPDKGPVHINLPFTEPLYFQSEEAHKPKIIDTVKTHSHIDDRVWQELITEWDNSGRKMILAGMLDPDPGLNRVIAELAKRKDTCILSESTSNLHNGNIVNCIDRTLAGIPEIEKKDYAPELLLTIGGQIVSKHIKTFLRKRNIQSHWHIHTADVNVDTYQSLTKNIPAEPSYFLKEILSRSTKTQSEDFAEKWVNKSRAGDQLHSEFIKETVYSDLTVFEKIMELLPDHCNVHYANSTPVRYSQLFRQNPTIKVNSNRGTSGIDGCVSTAAGAAWVNKSPTVLIVGDLGFFYDSNGLWHPHLDKNLKVIVINNGGGGIFRFIDGPSGTPYLEKFFESKHTYSAEHIAKAYQLTYMKAEIMEETVDQLKRLLSDSNGPAILEIFTPGEQNAEILKAYFRNLSNA